MKLKLLLKYLKYKSKNKKSMLVCRNEQFYNFNKDICNDNIIEIDNCYNLKNKKKLLWVDYKEKFLLTN